MRSDAEWWKSLTAQSEVPATACPLCKRKLRKFLYLGTPGWICVDQACSCVGGPASILMDWFNGLDDWALVVYEGSYFKALWQWLTGGRKEA